MMQAQSRTWCQNELPLFVRDVQRAVVLRHLAEQDPQRHLVQRAAVRKVQLVLEVARDVVRGLPKSGAAVWQAELRCEIAGDRYERDENCTDKPATLDDRARVCRSTKTAVAQTQSEE